MQRGAAQGLTHGLCVARLLACWFVLGAEFEAKPGFEWAQEILASTRREQGAKVFQLCRRSREELARLALQAPPLPGLMAAAAFDQAIAALDAALMHMGTLGSLLPGFAVALGEACDIDALDLRLVETVQPQAYRIERKVQRHIGDNALMIRKWPAMEGRIYAVAFAPDGTKFAAAGSLDGKGTLNFYNYDFNTEMPADMLAIEGKDEGARKDDEKARLAAHYISDTKLLATLPLDGGAYTICYRPVGATVAVAGEDGKVRFVNVGDAKVAKEFVPVPIGNTAAR